MIYNIVVWWATAVYIFLYIAVRIFLSIKRVVLVTSINIYTSDAKGYKCILKKRELHIKI